MKWAAHGEEQHGIGLKNVKKIVEKYNGTMEGTTQEGIFCVNLLFATMSGDESQKAQKQA